MLINWRQEDHGDLIKDFKTLGGLIFQSAFRRSKAICLYNSTSCKALCGYWATFPQQSLFFKRFAMTTQHLTLSRLNSASMIVKHECLFFLHFIFTSSLNRQWWKTGQLLMKLKYNNLKMYRLLMLVACCSSCFNVTNPFHSRLKHFLLFSMFFLHSNVDIQRHSLYIIWRE